MKEIFIDYPNIALFHYLKATAPSGLSFVSDCSVVESRVSSEAESFRFKIAIDPSLILSELAVPWLVNRSRKSGQLFDFKVGKKKVFVNDQHATQLILEALEPVINPYVR